MDTFYTHKPISVYRKPKTIHIIKKRKKKKTVFELIPNDFAELNHNIRAEEHITLGLIVNITRWWVKIPSQFVIH